MARGGGTKIDGLHGMRYIYMHLKAHLDIALDSELDVLVLIEVCKREKKRAEVCAATRTEQQTAHHMIRDHKLVLLYNLPAQVLNWRARVVRRRAFLFRYPFDWEMAVPLSMIVYVNVARKVMSALMASSLVLYEKTRAITLHM